MNPKMKTRNDPTMKTMNEEEEMEIDFPKQEPKNQPKPWGLETPLSHSWTADSS